MIHSLLFLNEAIVHKIQEISYDIIHVNLPLNMIRVGKIFARLEIIAVVILVIGIIIFSAADAASKMGRKGSNPMMGYLFMCGGVIFDSFTSNFEKKNIFRKHKATHCEAMFFASSFGFVWTLVTLLITDPEMLYDGFSFFINTPQVDPFVVCFFCEFEWKYAKTHHFWVFFVCDIQAIIWLMLSSIGAYMSVVFVLLLIKVYSTTYAECVKGVRKVCSIMASYLLLGKDKTFGIYHLCGVACFIGSSVITVYNKSLKSGPTKKDTKKDK